MKYFIFIFFFVLQLVGFSQQKKYSLPVISSTKSNVVYRGIPNPISIALPGFFSKDIVVNVNVGKLEKEESENDYTYFFEDTIQENQVTFSVFIKQKNRRIKLVGSWDFRLK
jgi:hypothetical protein